MNAFQTCFDRLIGHEGGYVNDPKDPGGETKFGISKRSYPLVDIKNLTREGARAIYLTDFWIAGQMEKMPFPLAFQAFDAAVNHGIPNAIRFVQRAAGVADDGYIGPVTLAAVQRMSITDVLMLFIAERLEFWTKCSTWATHGKGWAMRCVGNLRYAALDA